MVSGRTTMGRPAELCGHANSRRRRGTYRCARSVGSSLCSWGRLHSWQRPAPHHHRTGVARPRRRSHRVHRWPSPSASPTVGDAPLTVNFSSAGSNPGTGSALTYSWDFGDGTPAGSGASPQHVYEQVGTYTAKLTMTTTQGSSTSPGITVTVNQDPNPKYYVRTTGSTGPAADPSRTRARPSPRPRPTRSPMACTSSGSPAAPTTSRSPWCPTWRSAVAGPRTSATSARRGDHDLRHRHDAAGHDQRCHERQDQRRQRTGCQPQLGRRHRHPRHGRLQRRVVGSNDAPQTLVSGGTGPNATGVLVTGGSLVSIVNAKINSGTTVGAGRSAYGVRALGLSVVNVTLVRGDGPARHPRHERSLDGTRPGGIGLQRRSWRRRRRQPGGGGGGCTTHGGGSGGRAAATSCGGGNGAGGVVPPPVVAVPAVADRPSAAATRPTVEVPAAAAQRVPPVRPAATRPWRPTSGRRRTAPSARRCRRQRWWRWRWRQVRQRLRRWWRWWRCRRQRRRPWRRRRYLGWRLVRHLRQQRQRQRELHDLDLLRRWRRRQGSAGRPRWQRWQRWQRRQQVLLRSRWRRWRRWRRRRWWRRWCRWRCGWPLHRGVPHRCRLAEHHGERVLPPGDPRPGWRRRCVRRTGDRWRRRRPGNCALHRRLRWRCRWWHRIDRCHRPDGWQRPQRPAVPGLGQRHDRQLRFGPALRGAAAWTGTGDRSAGPTSAGRRAVVPDSEDLAVRTVATRWPGGARRCRTTVGTAAAPTDEGAVAADAADAARRRRGEGPAGATAAREAPDGRRSSPWC